MTSKGRVFLDCDYGRQRDFTVKSDVRLVYYANSTQQDWPIVVSINNCGGRIHVSVGQERPNGEMIALGAFSRDERYDDSEGA